MAPSNTALKHARSLNRGTGNGSSSSDPNGETLVVTLRVQVLSCNNLKDKDIFTTSDPFVVVSIMGNQFHTPVLKNTLNPVYEPKEATFNFPIYKSDLDKLGTLDFAVWDHDVFRNDFLGKCSLSLNEWFPGTAFAFNDRNNLPFTVSLLGSHSSTSVHGTMRIKVGFVYPHDLSNVPDYGKIYKTLINHSHQ